ncbi:hypothetical protein AOQ84DRAFT_246597, partial [Glonium stellatum]
SYSSYVDEQRNDHASVKSLSSSSSSGSPEKIKRGLGIHRLRRKLAGGSSIIEEPIYETEFARIGKGWWKDQQLVDRSIRSMALLTTVFAIAIVVVCIINMKLFYERPNWHSTSIGGETKSCKSVARTNTALLLIINIAATMVLGMSNTYQQLVTSLKMGDIKWVLQKHGDSRVGTNSPFSINKKREGRISSWLAWLLLICTSMPVHFLANSLIGPSLILSPPSVADFNATSEANAVEYFAGDGHYLQDQASFVCWSAFRTGAAHFPRSGASLSQDGDSVYDFNIGDIDIYYKHIEIQYSKENCTKYVKTTSNVSQVEGEWTLDELGQIVFGIGGCHMGGNVFCYVNDMQPSPCRLNIRMQAAFVLAGCLVAKAIY